MATLEKESIDVNLEELKKEKKISEEKLKLIEASLKGIEISEEELQTTKAIDRSQTGLLTKKDQQVKLEKEFEDMLPKWVNKPWMYISPKSTDKIGSWSDKWSKVLLDYTKLYVIHIISINKIRTVYPFKNEEIGKELSIEQLRNLVGYLGEKDYATWLDEEQKRGFFAWLAKIFGLKKEETTKLRARIKWKTNAEFAEDLLNFMLETGRVVEVHSLFDLSQFDEEWATLPPEDLIDVVDILVNKGVAHWLNREKTIMRFDDEKVF